MKHKFYGGVHPAEYKESTAHKPVVPLANAPAQVVIPMSMHLGAPCTPLVKAGETVTVGQQIGALNGLGAPIHASVSGKVLAVEPRPFSGGGTMLSVVIENDFRNTACPDCLPRSGWETLSPQALIEIIRDAGITGMGGAGFPTHVKLKSALGKADTVLINGAECEPYITSDHRLMLEKGEKILAGTRILMQALNVSRAIIGIEGNKLDAAEHLKSLLPTGETGISVVIMRTRYPQGAEKQLIQRLTGRKVPPGGLPADAGCCVFNVGTAAAVFDAVALGLPLTHRYITVTGSAVKRPINVLAPIGTSFAHLVEEAGGFEGTPARVLAGGPMMGVAQCDLAVSASKATNCVLCLSEGDLPIQDKEQTCLRCGRCVQACPMRLSPLYLHMYADKRMWRETEELRVMDCIECGSCQYICPARIPLVQSFRTSKRELRKLAEKQKEGTV